MKLSRRNVLRTAAAGAGALALGNWTSAFGQSNPIRIGVILPLSGPASLLGNDFRTGAEIAAAQLNRAGGVLGRQVELVFRDDRANPNDAIAAARELTGSGINLLVGGLLVGPTLATVPVLPQLNAVFITVATITMSLTHENFVRNAFRVSDNDYEQLRAIVRLAVEKFPNVTSWGCALYDLQALTDSWALFKKLLPEAYSKIGKTVSFVEPIPAKLGVGDFKNQINALMNSPAEGLLSMVFGQDGITFFQQARTFGLPGKLKAIIDRGNEFPFAKALKKNIPANFWALSPWNQSLYPDVALSRALYQDYVALTKDTHPSGFVANGFNPIMAYAQAITAAKGATDTATIINTLEGRTIQSAKGPLTFRKEDHQAIKDVVYLNIAPSDDETGFKVAGGVRFNGAELLEPPTPGVAFKP
ncbi:MAG TPA: ABC transporter substrate-binding protein [Burkholderiales bacterium]|nr:ABC transporter substrate-binding protein [Burkholderiales bacterium]